MKTDKLAFFLRGTMTEWTSIRHTFRFVRRDGVYSAVKLLPKVDVMRTSVF